MSEENSKEELAKRAALLDQRLKLLRNDLEKIGVLLMEFEKAKASIEGFRENNESYVQIGAGIMVKANLNKNDILVPIGSGYFLKTDPKKAIEKIDKLIELTNKNRDKVSEAVKKAENELIDIMKKVKFA